MKFGFNSLPGQVFFYPKSKRAQKQDEQLYSCQRIKTFQMQTNPGTWTFIWVHCLWSLDERRDLARGSNTHEKKTKISSKWGGACPQVLPLQTKTKAVIFHIRPLQKPQTPWNWSKVLDSRDIWQVLATPKKTNKLLSSKSIRCDLIVCWRKLSSIMTFDILTNSLLVIFLL